MLGSRSLCDRSLCSLPPFAQTASATALASAEAFGTPSVTAVVTVSATGIASAEAFGTPTATPGAVSAATTA